MIEQFSVQFRNTKTTVLTKANWSAGRHQSQPEGIQAKNRQISLNLIGWEGDTIFWDQSQCEIEQKQSNHELLSTLNWKQLYVHDGIWRIVLQANREKLMICTSILLCTSSERRLSLLTLPLIASLRLPPEPHKATNRILSSTQTRTPSLHCCWLFLPRMRVSAADYTSWHSWLAWAYGSDSALTDLERKPQGLDEISRWSKIRVDLHYLVFKFNCFV